MDKICKKEQIPTPALILDRELFEANLNKLAQFAGSRGVALRPHAKTHKCPEIARRQLAQGAIGISVATVAEAEALAAAGIGPLLLTSPVAEWGKAMRWARLCRSAKHIAAVGDRRQAEMLSEAARQVQVDLDLLLDLDVGDGRTGALPGAPALQTAQTIARLPRLHLRGIQAYAGHASHVEGYEARRAASALAWAKALETRDLLVRAGLDMSIVSGGSTGTYDIDASLGVTELQCGSYVFMDLDYRRISSASAAGPDFALSLTVLATVVSAAHSDRVTVDAGIKAFATDRAFGPEVKGHSEWTYRRAGDEFGILTAAGGSPLPGWGERVELYTPHCDPTVNLYDRLYVVQADQVVDVWPTVARRESLPLA